MKTITYHHVSLKQDESLLPQLIECYREVFSTSPWYEWKTCTKCGKKWGLEHVDELAAHQHRCCNQEVVDFWPTEVVARDIRKELSMPFATCWLAMDGEKVIGFSWGYALTPTELDTKLGISCGITGTDLLAYQDEIGVSTSYRGRHIASTLFRYRLRDFLSHGLRTGVMRTKTLPPSVTYLWFRNLGYRTTSSYDDADGRVIMVCDLHTLAKRIQLPLRTQIPVTSDECRQ